MDNSRIGGRPPPPPQVGSKRPRSPTPAESSRPSGLSTSASWPPRAPSEGGGSTVASATGTAAAPPGARALDLEVGRHLPPKARFKHVARHGAQAAPRQAIAALPPPEAGSWQSEREAFLASAAQIVAALEQQNWVAHEQGSQTLRATADLLRQTFAAQHSAAAAVQAQNHALTREGGVPSAAPPSAAAPAGNPAAERARERLLQAIDRGGSNNRYRRLMSLLKLDHPRAWYATIAAAPAVAGDARQLAAAHGARFVASLPATALDPYFPRLGLSRVRVYGTTFVAAGEPLAAAVAARAEHAPPRPVDAEAHADVDAASQRVVHDRLLAELVASEPHRRSERLVLLLRHNSPDAWDAAQRAVPARGGEWNKVKWERTIAFAASLPATALDAYFQALGVDHVKLCGTTFWSPAARAARATLATEQGHSVGAPRKP